MNKKDCEDIGYILTTYRAPQNICEAIFKLDDRIEGEYLAFLEVCGISDEVNERAEELMDQYNGDLCKHSWSHWSLLSQDRLVKTYKECLEEARKEIYGDDYDQSMWG